MHNQSPLRIGVSLHYRDDQQSIWENGIFQNCFFLIQMLKKMPGVEYTCLLIDREVSISLPDSLWMDELNIPVLGLNDGMETLNVVIEMSALLPDDWAHSFREKGGRYYWMRVGNDYFLDVERAVYNQSPASLVSDKIYDAIWTLPEYENSCKDYFELASRAPVIIVPHLWTPYFLERGISQLPANQKYSFVPGKERWRVAVMEPNISMVKTSLIPMLAIEKAYRNNPLFLERARICNALTIKEHPDFVLFAQSLNIVRHGLTSFEGRFPTPWFMASEADAVVSHHWENGQNYLYYELLYGGYPLIHNSSFLGDCGYRYEGFDATQAADKLLEAYHTHHIRGTEQKLSWCSLENNLSIDNESNIVIYKQLIFPSD